MTTILVLLCFGVLIFSLYWASLEKKRMDVYLIDLDAIRALEPGIAEMIEADSHGIKTHAMISGRFVLAWIPRQEWIDVYGRKRKPGDKDGVYTGDLERFGFSLKEWRWSYGDGPPGASLIKPEIKKLFNKK